MASGAVKSALSRCAQTLAGRVFSHEEDHAPQSAVPGDGCGVGYIVANDSSPIRSVVQRSYGEYADDMVGVTDERAEYLEPDRSALHIDFTESKIATVVCAATNSCPRWCAKPAKSQNIRRRTSIFSSRTSPNVNFRPHGEALLLPPEKQVHTFEEHGNLFGLQSRVHRAHAKRRR
jgi:3-oxoacyl-[acyl-carrier-protein] synthase-3